jgi:hypothetical protein
MLAYLIIIASIVLTTQAINTAAILTTKVLTLINNNRRKKRLTNNHPELQGVELDNLFVFIADDETRSSIISNEDEGDNIPMLSKAMGDWDDLFDEEDD